AREEALRRELEKVRGANQVIEKVIGSLEKSRDNMSTVNSSVRSASTLLDTWTRILSQTEHNQRLLLNPEWQGATQDLEDLENESILRQQAAERRAAEEDIRREAAARAAEEEERKRAATPSSSRGGRAR
ncbi:DASH complex subunit Duo1-domain-containing protein, partial [Elsinoe ampelina]